MDQTRERHIGIATRALRARRRGRPVELAAAALTAIGKFTIADWLGYQLEFTLGAIAFWVIFVLLRHKADPSILRRWGFTRARLGEASLLCGIAFVASAAFCVIFGLVSGNTLINWNLALLLLVYPPWGMIQQFLLVALLADNLMALTRERSSEPAVAMLTAVVFAGIHFPETPLMIATFFLGATTTLIFFRTRNIWLIGVLHGWFATLFYFLVMGVDPIGPLLEALA